MYTLPRVSVPHRNLVIKVEKDLEMEKHGRKPEPNIFASVWRFLRRCLFLVLALGPMPNHIAFIMDGNRRYAKRRNVKEGTGHGVGFTTLTSICQYCYEMGVKYVTVYAFSIDNFKRKPEEVQSLMDLMKEKIDELLEEESIVQKYGFRINFWGSLDLLSEPVRLAAEKAMTHTADNTGPVLSICVAYTSTNEIMRAIKKSCARKSFRTQGYVNCDGESVCEDINGYVTVADLEENLDTADCPDPDIVIRTSGEARLSNFLLWQTSLSHLQNPNPLWPEFSLRNLVWAILEYQKIYPYLEARRRLAKKEN
ncbi:dehydrodolichyl diphosphate synthase CPT3-like isoform X1 [Musa acuminata AAA Group]|uniref:dehydrodolichyl diphosphate synthase CPT3-like isoform X1 n=2 Tax=Musa acuminata AAA Group TaxID=214697 RepID=UPI0031DE2C55